MGEQHTEILIRLCGLGLVASIAVGIIKRLSDGMGTSLRLVGMVMLYGGVLALLLPVVIKLTAFTEGSHAAEGVILLTKTLGIALLVQISSELCRDMGEGGIGSVIETAGRAVILLLLFPTVEELLHAASELLTGV